MSRRGDVFQFHHVFKIIFQISIININQNLNKRLFAKDQTLTIWILKGLHLTVLSVTVIQWKLMELLII